MKYFDFWRQAITTKGKTKYYFCDTSENLRVLVEVENGNFQHFLKFKDSALIKAEPETNNVLWEALLLNERISAKQFNLPYRDFLFLRFIFLSAIS